ncbi:NUDIX hydrolase [Methyloceanibacter sp. wino2]|uniref:NUDIX hydrolase n=1 Tax=Methyloceanibacter sp. wino2 TaxID=2170729 RepID=UPI001FDFED04|nr:NUDIX domain-containing protein [Methyloceanibacter sp. wino2]
MSEPLKQIAALPVAETPDGPRVLLITTRGRGRWTIPRGWPKQGVPDSELAATEAAEEAGVTGKIDKTPIGSYTYTKRLHFYSWAKCVVDVYRLNVKTHEADWQEKNSRKVRWASPDEAASLVADAELASLLRSVFHLKAA